MHRLGGIEMKVKITVFKNGEKQSEKTFRIPKSALDSLQKKAEEMYNGKDNATFTIEEI